MGKLIIMNFSILLILLYQKKAGKPLAMPIVGTIISGISFIASTIIIIAFHTAINKLEQKYNEMDSTLNSMRDSLQRWDTLYFPGEYLDEPDSTFLIDYWKFNHLFSLKKLLIKDIWNIIDLAPVGEWGYLLGKIAAF